MDNLRERIKKKVTRYAVKKSIDRTICQLQDIERCLESDTTTVLFDVFNTGITLDLNKVRKKAVEQFRKLLEKERKKYGK